METLIQKHLYSSLLLDTNTSSVHSIENIIYMNSTVTEENEKAMKRKRRWRKGKKKKEWRKGVSSAADGRTEIKMISV